MVTKVCFILLFLYASEVYSEPGCYDKNLNLTVTSLTPVPSTLTVGGNVHFIVEGSNISYLVQNIQTCLALFYTSTSPQTKYFSSGPLACVFTDLQPGDDYEVTSSTYSIPTNVTAGNYAINVVLMDNHYNMLVCGNVPVTIEAQGNNRDFLELVGLLVVFVLS